MGKLLSVMYCVLNIYEGILMNALPVVAHCQNKYKRFALSVQLYCSTAHKTSRQSIPTLYAKKNITKARTLLYTAVHGLPF